MSALALDPTSQANRFRALWDTKCAMPCLVGLEFAKAILPRHFSFRSFSFGLLLLAIHFCNSRCCTLEGKDSACGSGTNTGATMHGELKAKRTGRLQKQYP